MAGLSRSFGCFSGRNDAGISFLCPLQAQDPGQHREDAETAHIETQPAGEEGPIHHGDVVSRMIADLLEVRISNTRVPAMPNPTGQQDNMTSGLVPLGL